MRVHDNIRDDTLIVERHVLLIDYQTANTLLPVSTRKLVSELGSSSLPSENLDDIPILSLCEHDLVDERRLVQLVYHGRWFVLRIRCGSARRPCIQRRFSRHHDLTRADVGARSTHAIRLVDPGVQLWSLRVDRIGQTLRRAIVEPPQWNRLFLQNMTSTKASIHTGLVEDESVLDIVPRIRHDGDSGVLSSGQLVVSDQFDSLGLYHRLLRICHEVEKGVDSVELIVGDRSDRLLSHRTLVGVSRGLVVVRIWDQTGDRTEDGERLDFEMRGVLSNLMLVTSDKTIVLLVDVEIFDETGTEKVVEGNFALFQQCHVFRSHPRPSLLHNNHRSTDSSTIAGDVNDLLVVIDVYRDEF